jgi:hypothetical protein
MAKIRFCKKCRSDTRHDSILIDDYGDHLSVGETTLGVITTFGFYLLSINRAWKCQTCDLVHKVD